MSRERSAQVNVQSELVPVHKVSTFDSIVRRYRGKEENGSRAALLAVIVATATRIK